MSVKRNIKKMALAAMLAGMLGIGGLAPARRIHG